MKISTSVLQVFALFLCTTEAARYVNSTTTSTITSTNYTSTDLSITTSSAISTISINLTSASSTPSTGKSLGSYNDTISTKSVHSSLVTITTTNTIAPSESVEIFHPTNIARIPYGPSFVPSGKCGLPQAKTNGKSPLGTLGAPRYHPFITEGSHLIDGFPWGSKTANQTNPYTQPPQTGVTRYYDFVVQRGNISPDGVERSVVLVNGQFPGPTIEANWGDTFQITVTNLLDGPAEGTSIHWHGLLQTGTPYMDGIPGITQCPIAPGTTFTYSFNADLYGTSWWHSHYSAQYAGGMFGAMIIHGPANAECDVDLGPLLLTDYYHNSYYDIVEGVVGTDPTLFAPHSDNNLINGKGIYNCSLVPDPSTCTPNAGLSKFHFEPGTSYRLRLINAGAEGIQKFSIDEHTLTVIAYDFVPVEPYETTIVTLGIGQRADVIVTAKSSGSAFWMRSTLSTCSLALQPDALAIIYYSSADTDSKPASTPWTDNTDPCANDPLTETVPFFPITPAAIPATTQEIDIGFAINATGHFTWTMNNSTFRVDYNDPILFLANEGNTSYPYDPEWNVYDFGNNSSIRIIIYNRTPTAHPMHLHGHNMFVLDQGSGTSWDGTIVNPTNTARRDVQLVSPNGYIVLQLDADNPGVWPFHCHIAWHVSAGLYVNILERPDDIANIDIPQSVTDTCNSWSQYTSNNIPDQIDSGL